jgi:hypothetical protein
MKGLFAASLAELLNFHFVFLFLAARKVVIFVLTGRAGKNERYSIAHIL